MDDKIITVEELQEKLNKNESVFILDVRPGSQRNEWYIAGSTHVDAYTALNAGDASALDQVQIPGKVSVVTVCAAGRTSLLAADLLIKKGIKALSLEGGMKAWNFAWNKAELEIKGARIIQIRRAAKGVLSYLVGSENEAVVIDAALNPEIYKQLAKDNGWAIKYVMDTHVHADYVSRTKDLAATTGAKHLMTDKAKVDYNYSPIANGQSVRFGQAELTFLETPGHTWESTTYMIGDDALFTGDTLFIDGIGRPDLKAEQSEAVEKAKALHNSLKRILSFNPKAIVLPAHTSNSVTFDNKLIGDTIENIRSSIKVSELSESDFIQFTLTKIPPMPPNYLTIAAINIKGSVDGQVLAELEAGGNHCAIK